MKVNTSIMFGIVCVLLAVVDISYAQDATPAAIDQTVLSEPVANEALINPAFTRYTRNGKAVGRSVPDGEILSAGLIPSPVDRSHLKGKKIKTTQMLVSAPAPSFDLRTLQQLTPVRNQGSCGVCWAFASIGSLESNLLRIDPATQSNFSENNMKNLLSSGDPLGYDRSYCDGGNNDMATAYLARWNGPVNEADDPYSILSGVSPAGISAQKHVQNVLVLPDRNGPLDNDTINQAVMQYGGVYTTLYMDTANSYKSTTNSLFYNGTDDSDHAVTIIGWDDNYSNTNFLTPPAGNGAFIVRNSWGSNWGQAGYFYVSYYDSNIGANNAVFVSTESPTNYSRAYQYDPLGMTSAYGYNGSTTAWFANVFTAAATESLAAVSFYTGDLNCSYEIRAYTGVTGSPISGTSAIPVVSGTLPLPGYHTITLPTSTTLVAGQNFSVVIKVTTTGDTYPIPLEKPYAGYSSKATSAAGQSYISSNGTSWTDLTTKSANSSVCLKAFTISAVDNILPVVSAFVIPATATSLTIPVTTFTATDGIGVTGYLITESATAPAAGSSGWTASAPTSFTCSAAGSKTAYAWAKDAAGNVSAAKNAPVSIIITVAVGDVDGSGNIDISDALKVLRFAVDSETPTTAQATNADVFPLGSDGKPLGGNGIDISDALLILKKSVGLASW